MFDLAFTATARCFDRLSRMHAAFGTAVPLGAQLGNHACLTNRAETEHDGNEGRKPYLSASMAFHDP